MVKNFLELLSRRQSSILSGATVLMITTVAAKILGLVRDRLLVHTFRPSEVANFLAAFRIPDLMFQLLIFGAVSVAFIPVFTEINHRKGSQEAFEFASDILNIVILGFIMFCILAMVFVQPLTELIVPGFSHNQQLLTANLTQIILLGQILLAVGAFFTGILQSYQRFLMPALAAVVYNLGIIIGIVFFVPAFGIYGPALGVVLGGALHVLLQLPFVSSLGFNHRLSFNLFRGSIHEVLRLMSMRTVGVAVEQINETVGIVLASFITSSSVTFLTFAQHLQTAPVGLFASSLAQAALPVLSQEKAKEEMGLFKGTFLTTFHQILFLTLPAAAVLIVLRIPVVRLIFGAAQFNWDATVLTGRTVAFLSLGLVAQSVVLLLARAFYALKDTKTPVIVSLITVTLNICLSYTFVRILHLPVWSLGLSYAIVSNFSVILLVFFLEKKIGGLGFSEFFFPAGKMVCAGVIAAIALYVPMKALDKLVFDTTHTVNLILLTGIASFFGLSIYLILVWIMRVRELETFLNLLKRLIKLKFDPIDKTLSDVESV